LKSNDRFLFSGSGFTLRIFTCVSQGTDGACEKRSNLHSGSSLPSFEELETNTGIICMWRKQNATMHVSISAQKFKKNMCIKERARAHKGINISNESYKQFNEEFRY